MDFHRFPVYFMRVHRFQGQKVGALWRAVATLWQHHPGPKERSFESWRLEYSNIRVLEARGLAGLAGLSGLSDR